jgi:hypothetical protein
MSEQPCIVVRATSTSPRDFSLSPALVGTPSQDPEAPVKRKSVGVAMLAFRRNLIRSFNPPGLVFTAYGYADLAADSPPASGSIT